MDRALNNVNMEDGLVESDLHAKGATEMPNPDLTRWLEMVWDALNEEDARTRDALLHAADSFLQSHDQEPGPLPFVDIVDTGITAA